MSQIEDAQDKGYGVAARKGNRADAPTVIGTHMHAYQIERFFGADVLKRLRKAARAGKMSERSETEKRRIIYTGRQIASAFEPEPLAPDALSKDVENAKLARARRQQIEGEVIPREDVVNACADAFRELQDAIGHIPEGTKALERVRDLFRK